MFPKKKVLKLLPAFMATKCRKASNYSSDIFKKKLIGCNSITFILVYIILNLFCITFDTIIIFNLLWLIFFFMVYCCFNLSNFLLCIFLLYCFIKNPGLHLCLTLIIIRVWSGKHFRGKQCSAGAIRWMNADIFYQSPGLFLLLLPPCHGFFFSFIWKGRTQKVDNPCYNGPFLGTATNGDAVHCFHGNTTTQLVQFLCFFICGLLTLCTEQHSSYQRGEKRNDAGSTWAQTEDFNTF